MKQSQASVRRNNVANDLRDGSAERDAGHAPEIDNSFIGTARVEPIPLARRENDEQPDIPPTPATLREAPAEAPPNQGTTGADVPAPVKGGRGRGRLRSFLMCAGIAAVLIGGGVYWLRGGRWVSADNAYIRAPKLMVSTDISGLVSSVDVKESQRVKAGDVLFRVDPQQFQIALDSARAQLASVRISLLASKADYRRLLADVGAQEAQVSLGQVTNDRAEALIQSNAGTKAAYDQARYALAAAKNQLASLRQQADAALARLGGSVDLPVEQHPQYMQAKAQVDEMQRQLDHTIIRAPFDGVVTAVDSLQPGTYLVAQTAALTNTGAVALVATHDAWITANLKETDLTYVKNGDPVEFTVDAYPGREWKGHVESLSPASGSEFSILPAQNASGNWVKVVQRVPIRIAVDRKPGDPELRAGMSVIVEIDTGHKRVLSELWGGARDEAGASINGQSAK